MLTIEMKINGTIIGQIYAHNEGGALGFCDYKWHCYMMDLQGNPTLYEGLTSHQRQKGFTALAEKLLKEYNDRTD